jgi:protein TonB
MLRHVLAIALVFSLFSFAAIAAQKPEIIEKTAPKYPAEAKAEKVSGPVTLEILISTEGRVTEAKAVNETDSRLIQAAIDAVKQWKFKPVLKSGKPVAAKAKITVNFQLK